jgi:hypothetical protein
VAAAGSDCNSRRNTRNVVKALVTYQRLPRVAARAARAATTAAL